jgi:hypothetical protein
MSMLLLTIAVASTLCPLIHASFWLADLVRQRHARMPIARVESHRHVGGEAVLG